MSKKKNPSAAHAAALEKPATAATVKTIHGETLPEADLVHIAPALRSFAIGVDQLKRDPNNARQHGDEDLAATAGSLKRFGQQHLLHFDPETRFVKVGNGRHEAGAAVLGWKYMAAVPSNLPPEQLRAFALADNRTAEKSRWDGDALQRELDALGDLQIDLTNVGFAAADLRQIEQEIADLIEEDPATIPMKRKRGGKSTGGESGGDDGAAETGDDLKPQFKIVIACDSEPHQANLLERFNAEGLSVRSVTA